MISDREKSRKLIEVAKQPLAELTFSLNDQGYGAKAIAILYLQTSLLLIHTHYGLDTTKEVCTEEFEEFEKFWRTLH